MWQAWMLKGRTQDERSHAVWIKVIKCISLVGLLFAAAAGLWPYLMPYDIVVKFIVTAGATVLTFQAFHTRHYAFATVFGALALLYNPVAPVLSFSGEWQGSLVVASAVPFVGSLTWRNEKLVPNG